MARKTINESKISVVVESPAETPKLGFKAPSTRELEAAGFRVDKDFVYGWRTQHGRNSAVYIKRNAPYFPDSFDTNKQNTCSHGLYLAGIDWLRNVWLRNAWISSYNYYTTKVVPVRCKRNEILKCEDKFRCMSFWVEGHGEVFDTVYNRWKRAERRVAAKLANGGKSPAKSKSEVKPTKSPTAKRAVAKAKVLQVRKPAARKPAKKRTAKQTTRKAK